MRLSSSEVEVPAEISLEILHNLDQCSLERVRLAGTELAALARLLFFKSVPLSLSTTDAARESLGIFNICDGTALGSFKARQVVVNL